MFDFPASNPANRAPLYVGYHVNPLAAMRDHADACYRLWLAENNREDDVEAQLDYWVPVITAASE